MTKPISPEEISDEKTKQIPPEVIEAFNFLITRNYDISYRLATVTQDDVIEEIVRRTNLKRGEIFDRKFLDVEDIYREEGWLVEYDKPAYNEDFKPTFVFKKPTK